MTQRWGFYKGRKASSIKRNSRCQELPPICNQRRTRHHEAAALLESAKRERISGRKITKKHADALSGLTLPLTLVLNSTTFKN